MTPDLISTREALDAGRVRATDLIDAAAEAARAPAHRHALVRESFDAARAAAAAFDAAAATAPSAVLGGLPIVVKDLFDIAGEVTAAGSTALADRPPAAHDAPAVARLRAAGAIVLGRSNMTEFAFSGVGINPHFGTPANPATAALDAAPRIPGGSTSGGAVSVACGVALAALGSDTGGSIRIPAALQGLVGFKNTARLTPIDGAVPLSTSLDTSCALTRSVRDAVVVHEVLAARRVAPWTRPLAATRLGVPQTLMLEALEPPVAAAFERTLERLARAGATIVPVALPELGELAAPNAAGGLPACESWAWHRRLLARCEARYDPRVAARIRRGDRISARDHEDLLAARRDWIARVERALDGFDALLSPTVPIVAPPIGDLVDDDARFFAVNALLLRNPSAVNFLDGCALSLPCHRQGEWPVGLMVWGAALRDDAVLGVAAAIESALASAER